MNDSLNQVFDTHKQALLGFISKRLDDPAMAEDLMQDLYLKLQNKDYQDIQYPKAYLYRMANSMIIDEQRRQARYLDSAEIPEEQVDPQSTPENRLQEAQKQALVNAAVQELPEKTKDVFYLVGMGRQNKRDVASQLDISVNMVEKHLRKALEYCRMKIKKSE